MNELQIFENAEFGAVRTLDIEGKIYFVGQDVSVALGYAKPRNAITTHCKGALKRGILTNGGKLCVTRTTKVTGKGQVYFVNKFINKESA